MPATVRKPTIYLSFSIFAERRDPCLKDNQHSVQPEPKAKRRQKIKRPRRPFEKYYFINIFMALQGGSATRIVADINSGNRRFPKKNVGPLQTLEVKLCQHQENQ